ncbi:hypothetical protein [Mycobacteroides abscessus]|uniref:hypothetical protein n=1 Tax=Mycobacteroides abscessus TaxID=36809 RepID=UPI00092B1316|nr:hypothetical protein [Mycobacteroides abscessus]SHY27720.1 Uncharacterised protein [Mycobacteroides abscessus subsp. abscessus]SIK18349.1 Uncharacterised protein [Mycobacteroides abscessus subsp. abscessus]SIM42639.1 Uncharacterised protein [Mycobacteroides abscessus subsp. abscessus]SKM13177.1 Uncharacterised protein [Mycobacteroides abscessus subsp. massiliense]SKM88446.1 Uncharacterised protein [Mycobacteroides abscessus subsp. massiliense]
MSSAAMMSAAQVLDAIALKYPDAVLLCEMVIADPAHAERAKQWHATYGVTEIDIPFPAGATRRIDALMLDGSTCRTAIEVKVSRADFLRETPEKRAAWERVTDRFVYACPAGLIEADEVPEHCGLWWIGPDQSVVIKSKARKNRAVAPLPHQLTVAVAYRLKRFESELRRLKESSA